MKHIYLVRHGETEGNIGNIVQDESSRLSVSGHKQAIRVAERLLAVDFSHLVVSSYERARQTAEPIAHLNEITPSFSDDFVELKRPSEFINKPKESAYAAFVAAARESYENPTWRHSDEENISDVLERLARAVQHIESLEGDIVIVSHGRFLKYLTMYLIAQKTYQPAFWKAASDNFFMNNTGITSLKFDGTTWKLISFNDHAHFAE